MKRITKGFITLILALVMIFAFACCSQEQKEESVNTTGMSDAEIYAVYKDIYDTPSSYIGREIVCQGYYATGEDGDVTVELICVEDESIETFIALEFHMRDGKEHLPVRLENQRIQVRGIIAVAYTDGTTSLDEENADGALAEQKKIDFPFIYADVMSIMIR